jgi:inner membrane protein
MDPITHTLTGGALAGSGLRRVSPGATATLLLASNAPDIDALAYLGDPYWALAFRRGLTHGPLGILLLPPLMVGTVVLWKRWRRVGGPAQREEGPAGGASRVPRPLPLLGLAYLGVALHQLMDWTNSYGTRFWEPISSRWSYLDALFIVDPWIWVLLGGGLLVAWRWGDRWVQITGTAAVGYILFMVVSSAWARGEVRAAWEVQGAQPALEVMVAPAPVNALAGSVVVETENAYYAGSFHWFRRPRVRFRDEPVPKIDVDPGLSFSPQVALDRARQDPRLRNYLVWSRFPYFRMTPLPGGGAEVLAHIPQIAEALSSNLSSCLVVTCAQALQR